MASAVFRVLKRFPNLKANALLARSFASVNLYTRISPLGDPSLSLVPVLDQCVGDGMKVKCPEVRHIIRDLRRRRRYSQALEVSEWMRSKELCLVSSGDCAVRLDLIDRVCGLDAAESYFDNLSDQLKNDKTYGALLNCYVRERLVEKSLTHMQKMTELGFASSALCYNDLMNLYTLSGQLEKVPDVLLEMKKNGVSPNNFSYRICIDSHGTRSDLNSMEKVLEEMESQPFISMDWRSYSMVANFYIKAAVREKSLVYLKKCEEKVNKDALGYNHLISHYANLGNKDEMMRLWTLQKTICKKQVNRDYVTMLGGLVKIGDLEETEKLLKEWESCCQFYDSCVPNILLIGYTRNGLIEKAEAMAEEFVRKGKAPTPNSWGIVADGYLERQNMEKVFECMKKALTVREQNKRWRPKPKVISSVLSWLSGSGDIEELEAFVSSLKSVIPVNREMYHELMKAYIRVGKEVDCLLQSMNNDKIDADEETEKILSLTHK